MKKLWMIALIVIASGCDTAQQVLNSLPNGTGGLTTQEIVSGLKEALTIGTQNGTNRLSAVNGFFANAAVKILMPPQAQKVENTLRSLGMGKVVDQAVESMNHAAENAAAQATPIFVNAIKQMTITDALGILRGGDTAATNYFRRKTTGNLTSAFRPVVDQALTKVNATKYWSDVFTVYNKFSTTPVNTDLDAYVTQKAIDGIFYEVGQEERKIRQDPAARVTDILKKVFGSAEAKQ